MELIVISSQSYGSSRAFAVRAVHQIWHRVKLRKPVDCASCKLAVHDEAFAPITNATNRADRLCPECAGKWALKVLA